MIRLRDVAERSGFSIGTVSKVLNRAPGSHLYSEATCRKINAAARELGYRPNYHARSLQTGRAHALGMVMGVGASGFGSGFWGPMIGGVDVETRAAKHHFVLIGTGEDRTPMQQGMRFLHERRVDGLVAPGFVWGLKDDLPDAEALRDPIVLVEYARETSLPVVELDDGAGVRQAVEHLAELGHRRICFIHPADDGDLHVRRRRDAFDACIREHSVQGRALALARPKAGWFEDEVEHWLGELGPALRTEREATALLTYDESLAVAAYAALRAQGRSVPEDVSVIGFNDIYARAAYPPMTVISHRLEAIGRQAVRLLMEMVRDPAAYDRLRGHREWIPSELVVRKSTAPPRD